MRYNIYYFNSKITVKLCLQICNIPQSKRTDNLMLLFCFLFSQLPFGQPGRPGAIAEDPVGSYFGLVFNNVNFIFIIHCEKSDHFYIKIQNSFVN